MRNLIEFNVVIYFNDSDKQDEVEKYRDMGINIPQEEDKEEKIVKYSFDATKIVEVRETFVNFKGENLPAVVVMFVVEGKLLAHTPALLVTYEEFKRKVNEHNQKNSEVK